jgi:hypothetical protein
MHSFSSSHSSWGCRWAKAHRQRSFGRCDKQQSEGYEYARWNKGHEHGTRGGQGVL